MCVLRESKFGVQREMDIQIDLGGMYYEVHETEYEL